MNFIAVDYHKNNLFHGDIKPENIFFYDSFSFYLTSDLGSLMHLGEPNVSELEPRLYLVTQYTEEYASPQYIEAVKNKTPLSR